MKTITFLSLLVAPIAVQAHYIFSQVFVNGAAKGGDYTYIRKNSNSYMPSFTNDVVNSNNLRCNSGAQPGSAQTLTVKAGDEIGFKLWYNEFIEHPGPGFVYMSKAPGSVSSYDGSGQWFKVWQSGICNGRGNVDTDWCLWQKDRITFRIPTSLPAGEYLVRVEHIAVHEMHVQKGQHYMECAQLKVESSGTGTPGPLVSIPGIYRSNDPGLVFNKWTNNPAQYIMPGPAVWNGGSTQQPPTTNPPPTNPSGAPLYGQCGGNGWTGPTTCAQGTCKATNEWYSQCVP